MKTFKIPFLLVASIFFLSSCGNFKIVTINDLNKSENSALKSKVNASEKDAKITSKTEKFAESQIKAEKVVDAARNQLGTPHLLKNPKKKVATDCSGMTCKSYSSVGVTLPRTTTGQAETGKFVPKKSLQKGDLVFFTSKKNKGKISHVGLISRVEENGKIYFIHTSTSRGVVEDDFYMKHWQDNFVTARRVL
ncbi:cell wall-associated hydrolase, invasion-associated protein [Bernardetia litoralis DSM 6794]|uniref:Cell wall-associated hydrolase, invasion-associated protein n=1 Tax=Bernardetia litoralis (strain ATCC 23117 / DSM 6794 / NBRC 15988 / NCIMB 1366 / Fx l1 / Sio-4) TaxID=880071 RepID=I4AQ78_BERLS|nr:C40 family peptidase [Bernardetia litoralis]AFM06113.1 cell wall-associated hydrolase, invasion-associated protein [Bernardetia litoralis DSM 6794]